MADSTQSHHGPEAASGADRLNRLGAEYEAAWQATVKGGPPPRLESYLEQVPEAEQAQLRQKLEKILGAFRLRETLDTEQPAPPAPAAAVDHVPGASAPANTVDHVRAPDTGAGGIPAARPRGKGRRERPTVPGYEILGELGQGGMGVVYQARQTALNRLVALKMVLAGAHATAQHLARFHAEALAIARLQHPNIVQIYEVGEHHGLPYFSLEFVDGGPLDKKIDREPQPPRDAARLAEILARAMHFAHQRGILHRDLKPGNVLLTADGTPKITDFGLAKAVEDEDSSQTRSGTLLGTPSYMSPEQARGQVHAIGPSADLYSLGAVLYELLTGRPPFQGATLMDTLDQVRTREPVPPTELQPKVPTDLETICLKCLQKEPGKRYANAEALADDLGRFLRGEPIHARPVGPVERLWRWSRRNPWVASLGTAVFLLLFIVAGVSLGALVIINDEKNHALAAQKQAEKNEAAANKAQREAQEANQVASRQADVALTTVGTLVDKAQAQLEDREERTRKLRQELVDTAMKGLEEILKTPGRTGLLGRITAKAHLKRVDIYRELGRAREALQEYELGCAIVKDQAVDEPQSDRAQGNLAAVSTKLAIMSMELGNDARAARDYYGQALARWEKLLTQPCDNFFTPLLVKQSMASSLTGLGIMSLRVGDPRAAWDYATRALALWEGILAGGMDSPGGKEIRADTYQLLGDVSWRLGDADATHRYFAQCLELREGLVTASPDRPNLPRFLAIAAGIYGDALYRLGDAGKAREYYTRSLNRLQELTAKDPENTEVRWLLALAHYRLATVALRRDDASAARQAYQEALKLREGLVKAQPSNQPWQNAYMVSLARRGQHARAAEIAARVAQQSPKNGAILIEVACCYAQCSAAATDDPALREAYARRAVEALRQAIEPDFKDVVALETEPDLEPIRRHAGFQAVLAELKRRLSGPREPEA
jgi:serine/threonine-protein kinase